MLRMIHIVIIHTSNFPNIRTVIHTIIIRNMHTSIIIIGIIIGTRLVFRINTRMILMAICTGVSMGWAVRNRRGGGDSVDGSGLAPDVRVHVGLPAAHSAAERPGQAHRVHPPPDSGAHRQARPHRQRGRPLFICLLCTVH